MRMRRLLLAATILAACEDEPIQEPAPLRDLSTAFEYPLELWDQGAEGQTILMLRVTAMGDVDSAYVATSSGFAGFDSAAVRGVRGARFAPGRQGDERISMWIRLPVRFRHETDARTPGTESS